MKTRKRLNVRFLVCVLGAVAVCGIAVHLVHGYQVKRNASALLQRADKAREDKDDVKEMEYLMRYLGFRPKDSEALARYGEILDEQAQKAGSVRRRMQAFLALEAVLRLDPERRDIRRRQIDTAMALGKFRDALEHLKELCKSAPEDAELERLKGLCKEASGHYAEAVADYESAIRHAPDQVENYLRVAALYHDRLDNPKTVQGTPKANKILNAMVESNAKDFRAYLGRARYLLQREGQSKSAVKQANDDVRQASELAPDEPDVVLMTAEVARMRGNPKQAEEILSKGLQSHPREAREYLALVALEVREDKTKEALKVVRQGLKELSDNGDLLHVLADLLVQSGELEEAAETIKRLRKMNYALPLLDYLQARIHIHESEWSAAEQILARVHSQLARLPGVEVQALLLLGQCHERLGNPDQALLAYQQARKLDPFSVAAHYRAGTTLMALGRASDALAEFRSILAGSKIPPGLHAVMARALITTNLRLAPRERDLGEIRRELDLAAKEAPDALELPVLQAETLLLDNKGDEARWLIDKALKNHPDEAGLWIASAQLSKREEALRVLDQAQARSKLAESVELRLARLSYLMQPPADPQKTPEQRKKAADQVRPMLNEMEKEATKLSGTDRPRLLNGLADAHLRLGDSAEAERLWRQVAEQQPNNLGIRLVLFDLALVAKDSMEVERLLAEIHRIEGENGTFWRYGEAARLIQQARPAEKEQLSESARRQLRDARQYLIKAGTLRPSWARIPALEAEIDEMEGAFSTATEKYQQALELGDRRPAIIRRTVQLLFEQQRFEDANRAVRKLQDQESVLLSAGLGKLAVENLLAQDPSKRDSEHALELIRKSVNPDSKSYQDHLWLGRILGGLGKQAEAEKALRRACELGETASETWVALVAFLAGSDKKREAEQAIEQARKKLPAEPSAVALAACYEIIGDLPKAEEHFLTALKAAPQDVQMLRNAAGFYIRHDRPGKAEPHLRALLALDKKPSAADIAWARRVLAAALASSADRRRFEEAENLIQKNLAESKNSTADEHAHALLLATRISKRKEAIRLFEDLHRRSSLSANDRFTLVRLYLAEENWTQAQRNMMMLLASPEGKNPNYQAYYARLLLSRGSVTEAQEQLDKLEKALPDTPLTREIKARVLQAQGKDTEAVAVVREYARSKAADLAAAALLLETLSQQSDRKGLYRTEAEAMYRKFVALSDKPERFLALAGFLGRKHAVAEALSCCEQALQQKAVPEGVAQVMTAVLRETPSEDQSKRVEKSLKEMLAKKPESIPLLVCLADLYDLRERFAEAEALYRQVLRKDEDNLIALNNLAWLLAFKKLPARAEALAVINKAIDRVGPSPELLDTRGVIYLMLSQSDRALVDLQQAVAQSPSPNRSFHLARALAAANKLFEAGQTLKEANKRGFKENGLHPLEQPLVKQLKASLEN